MLVNQDCLGKLCKVTWKDSTFDLGWNYDRVKPVLPSVTTYGIVSWLDEDVMEISSTIGKERGWLNPLQIPTGSVEKVEIL
jgi:hypothetical protein